MKTLLTFTLCLLMIFPPIIVSAASFHTVQTGEIWHLDKLVKNPLVRILGKKNGWVKIQYENGLVGWVRPSQLLNKKKLNPDNFNENVVSVLIGIGIFACLMNPGACKDLSQLPQFIQK